MCGAVTLSVCAQARENLELSFTAEAEMVFTTLSSTGRRIFARLPAPFETVLVDEAAQASEIAALQALAFGCRRRGPAGRGAREVTLLPVSAYKQGRACLQTGRDELA